MWLAAGGALALLLLLVVLLLTVAVRRSGRRQAVLSDRVRALEAQLASPGSSGTTREPHLVEQASYVITGIGDGEDDDTGRDRAGDPVPGHVDRAVFADIVAREGVIKAAGLAHGLRRALAAETRNRIRFEVRREVKRSRKQRRSDLRTALRDMQARERARMAEARDEGDAA